MVRRIRALCLVILVVAVSIHAWDLSRPGLVDRTGRLKVPDFLQFYTYGALLREGHAAALYDATAHADVARRRVDPRLALSNFHPNYSPIIALVMAPLSAATFLQAAVLWSGISALLYGISMWLLVRCTENVRRDPLTVALVAASWPALFVLLRYGQISSLTLALVSLSAFFHHRRADVAAGLALGAIVYKPNLLVAPLLLFLIQREWRIALGAVLGASLELALDVALTGPSAMSEYVGILVTLAARPELVQIYAVESHSLRGFARMMMGNTAILQIVAVAAVVSGVWAAMVVWRGTSDVRPRYASLVLAMAISSPHLLTYDLLLLAVPLVFMVDSAVSDRALGAHTGWRWALALMFLGAWPGTLIAKLYGVQMSTIGMAMGLWLLADYSTRRLRNVAGASSSINPIIIS